MVLALPLILWDWGKFLPSLGLWRCAHARGGGPGLSYLLLISWPRHSLLTSHWFTEALLPGPHISIIWPKSQTETSKPWVNLSKLDDFSSDFISDWDETIKFVVISSQLKKLLLKILACIVSTCEVYKQGLGSSAGYLIQCLLANSIDF